MVYIIFIRTYTYNNDDKIKYKLRLRAKKKNEKTPGKRCGFLIVLGDNYRPPPRAGPSFPAFRRTTRYPVANRRHGTIGHHYTGGGRTNGDSRQSPIIRRVISRRRRRRVRPGDRSLRLFFGNTLVSQWPVSGSTAVRVHRLITVVYILMAVPGEKKCDIISFNTLLQDIATDFVKSRTSIFFFFTRYRRIYRVLWRFTSCKYNII